MRLGKLLMMLLWFIGSNYSSYGGSFSMNGSAGLSTYIFRQSYEEEINPFYRQSIQWYSAAGWDETGW